MQLHLREENYFIWHSDKYQVLVIKQWGKSAIDNIFGMELKADHKLVVIVSSQTSISFILNNFSCLTFSYFITYEF